MSDLSDFMECGAVDASMDAGESISIGGETVRGTFDEFQMSTDALSFGDKEEINASLVIPSLLLEKIPAQKSKIKRLKDGIWYRVISVNTDAGHVILRLNRMGKRQSNGA